MIMANIRWAVFCAATRKKMAQNLNWQEWRMHASWFCGPSHSWKCKATRLRRTSCIRTTRAQFCLRRMAERVPANVHVHSTFVAFSSQIKLKEETWWLSIVPLMTCGVASRANLSKALSSGSLVPTSWGNWPCSASQVKTIQGLKQWVPSKKRKRKFELPAPFKGSNLSVQWFILFLV